MKTKLDQKLTGQLNGAYSEWKNEQEERETGYGKTELGREKPYIDLGDKKKQELYKKYLEGIGSSWATFY